MKYFPPLGPVRIEGLLAARFLLVRALDAPRFGDFERPLGFETDFLTTRFFGFAFPVSGKSDHAGDSAAHS
jgi:hypothetical protein